MTVDFSKHSRVNRTLFGFKVQFVVPCTHWRIADELALGLIEIEQGFFTGQYNEDEGRQAVEDLLRLKTKAKRDAGIKRGTNKVSKKYLDEMEAQIPIKPEKSNSGEIEELPSTKSREYLQKMTD